MAFLFIFNLYPDAANKLSPFCWFRLQIDQLGIKTFLSLEVRYTNVPTDIDAIREQPIPTE